MSESKQEFLRPGTVFEKYTVERLLGKGGMGAVYLVRHNVLDSHFALKVLFPDVAEKNKQFVDRFIREAKLACKIKHPNLIAVHDAGKNPENGMYYIVMDYVSGGSVRELLKKMHHISPDQALQIIRQITGALGAAYEHRMVHRDIKPDNIMFAADGTAKLADLGIAKSTDDQDTQLTMAASVFGTPAYMSPEQAKDSSKVDCRADIYSLGIVFYEMLSGERPFQGDGTIQILSQVVSDDAIPDVRQLRPEVPESMATLLAAMTEKDREKRVQTPVELMTRLEQIRGTDKSAAAQPAGNREMEEPLTMPTIIAGDGTQLMKTVPLSCTQETMATVVTPSATSASEKEERAPAPAVTAEKKQDEPGEEKKGIPKKTLRIIIALLAAMFLLIMIFALIPDKKTPPPTPPPPPTSTTPVTQRPEQQPAKQPAGQPAEKPAQQPEPLPPPAAPVVSADKTEPTSSPVVVSAKFSADSVSCQYSFDQKNWDTYKGAVTLKTNGSIYFRGKNKDGKESEVVEYRVTNIELPPPAAPVVSADKTAPTSSPVLVSAKFSNESVSHQYSFDQFGWNKYEAPIEMKENGKIYFRAKDKAGNISETAVYEVKNIVKEQKPPAAPVVSVDKTEPTSSPVLVSAKFSDESVSRQYSFDQKNWDTYKGAVTRKTNGSIYFRAKDKAGNISEVVEYRVTNIDTEPPAAPVVSADKTDHTSSPVLVSAEFSNDSVSRQYSFDRENWDPYKGAVTRTTNGSIYFRALDKAGNVSKIKEYKVANIVKIDEKNLSKTENVYFVLEKPVSQKDISGDIMAEAIFENYRCWAVDPVKTEELKEVLGKRDNDSIVLFRDSRSKLADRLTEIDSALRVVKKSFPKLSEVNTKQDAAESIKNIRKRPPGMIVVDMLAAARKYGKKDCVKFVQQFMKSVNCHLTPQSKYSPSDIPILFCVPSSNEAEEKFYKE